MGIAGQPGTTGQLGIAGQPGTTGQVGAASCQIRGLMIDQNKRECELNEEKLELTPMEFDILWYLCSNQGRVVSSEELFEQVWKEKYLENNNTVMAHITRIREKMHEVPRKPKYIKTVWGVGYKIE